MEREITFILNQELITTKENHATVLLDFIRKKKNLTGTKEVCKEGDCGACAVLLGENKTGEINYKIINSCLFPLAKVSGKHIVTIEGLNHSSLSPIQKSILEEGASQCGFCTPGFIISITGYLLNTKKFHFDDAINSIAGNICRCTGYHSIIRAIKNIGKSLQEINIGILVSNEFVPDYFLKISDRLKDIEESSQNIIINRGAKLVSGGTDLFVQKPDELLDNEITFSENLLAEDIRIFDNKMIISGSATVSNLEKFIKKNNTNLNFQKLFNLFASLPIRNSATLAGNIINASPIADLTITLLSLNASLVLSNLVGDERTILLENFYLGYKTLNKNDDEILKEIHYSLPKLNNYFNFEKISKRTHLDIASVNSAISVELEGNTIIQASLSAGGVSPIPLKLKKASTFLINKNICEKTLFDLIEISLSEISPISDVRGSKEYKSLLLEQLLKAHFHELFPKYISEEVFL